MNQLVNLRRAKHIAWTLTGIFLLIHIVLLLLFGRYRIMPMFYFNIFSVLFYLLSFLLIAKGFLRFFVISTYLEVVLHMCLAACFTGWENGFQITLVGISFLVFFSEYIGRTLQLRIIHALPLCSIGMVGYLLSYCITRRIPAAWPFPDHVSFWLNITWCIITFFISTISLQGFTFITFHSEVLLSSQVTTDELTGLPNRYYVSLHGTQFVRPQRWVAMMDIDDFKRINDTYGHNFGDEVLRTLAQLTRELLPDATVCRWGGEEFLLFGASEDIEKQRGILDDFRAEVEKRGVSYQGEQISYTVTIGLSAYEADMEVSDWINLADKKLYLGKRSGKNRVVL